METDLSPAAYQLSKTKDMMAKDDTFGATSGVKKPLLTRLQIFSAITFTLAL